MPRWTKVAEPATRHKGIDFGDRSTIATTAGQPCPYLAIVGVDYRARQYLVWFQDIGLVKLPWLDSDPSAIAATVHDGGRLKLAVAHYRGDGQQRELVIYDTGMSFVED